MKFCCGVGVLICHRIAGSVRGLVLPVGEAAPTMDWHWGIGEANHPSHAEQEQKEMALLSQHACAQGLERRCTEQRSHESHMTDAKPEGKTLGELLRKVRSSGTPDHRQFCPLDGKSGQDHITSGLVSRSGPGPPSTAQTHAQRCDQQHQQSCCEASDQAPPKTP